MAHAAYVSLLSTNTRPRRPYMLWTLLKDFDGRFERWTIHLYHSSQAMDLNVDDLPKHAKRVAHARYNLFRPTQRAVKAVLTMHL